MCENISEWMQEWLCFPQRGQWWIAYQTFYICRFFYSKNPLLVAQVATPCSHSFCEWCVNKIKSKYARRVIKCESCREPVSGWCKNLLANNFLSMVDGECKWCSKKVKLNNAKDHIEYCEEMEGPCKQCKAIVRHREEDAHSAYCSMADVLCPCGLTFKRADEESYIQTMCGLTEVPCPLNCGNVKRLVKHIWYVFFAIWTVQVLWKRVNQSIDIEEVTSRCFYKFLAAIIVSLDLQGANISCPNRAL